MKRLFSAVALGLGLVLAAGNSVAQSAGEAYPARTIKLIAPGPPGASTDAVTRLVADKLSQSMGQPVVVENRPGANGVVAVRTLMQSKPDGYTLALLYSDSLVITPFLSKTPPFDPLKDVAYISTIGVTTPFIIAVHPSVPAQSFNDLVRLAKSAPKRVRYSTYGQGSGPQLSFESLATHIGAELLHVPYKGGAASYQAAVAGEVDVVSMTSSTDLIKAGRLRALAVGGSKRWPGFPDVPSLGELGYPTDIFMPVVYGFAAPVGTPPEIVNRLAREFKRITDMPDIIERFERAATYASWADATAYRDTLGRMIDTYQPVIRRLGLATD